MAELRKKLCRGLGILYRLKKNNFSKRTLLSVYYAIFYSYLIYGITAWGFAPNQQLHGIQVLQNKVFRIIGGLNRDANVNAFCNNNKLLKINELHYLELAKIMWDFDKKMLPTCFESKFTYINDVDDYNTRTASTIENEVPMPRNKLSENILVKTQYGMDSLKFKGPKILNQLKDLPFFNTSSTKCNFATNLTKHLLLLYES